jgi:catechol 2,3-dioxygenase-like lactoylglutathione lyase family enzyme
MTININGIAHIQLSINDPQRGLPFWEELCHFMEMETLIKGEDVVYCIGGRTGILVRAAPQEKRNEQFDQDRSGLHHFCFRVRSNEDIDAVFEFVKESLMQYGARIVHPPEDGSKFAPGYYSLLIEDPDGIRVEFNHVPGKGHFGAKGRLADEGSGPATRYGEDGLTDG